MRLLQITTELLGLSLSSDQKERRLRESLERLGSVFIKFGQLLALRRDVISDEYSRELFKLLDQVPAFPKAAVEEILQQNYPQGIPFQDFDFKPLASASFAQVHQATLQNGQQVAIKIQRPNLERIVQKDLRIMKVLAKTIDLIFRPANKLFPIVQEFEQWTKAELDYRLEAESMQIYNSIPIDIRENISAPKAYVKISTEKILVMDLLQGWNLNEIINARETKNKAILEKLQQLKFDREVVVKKIIKQMLKSAHISGYFHADPHPANIFFTNKGEVVLLDFGIVGKLSQKERILLLRYLRATVGGETETSFKAILGLSSIPNNINLDSVKTQYDKLMSKFQQTFSAPNYLEQQKQTAPILMETLALLQKHEIVLPVNIIRYFKAFETVEGLIFALYPELEIKEMAKEIRNISIINLVEKILDSLDKKGMDSLQNKFLNALEEELL